MERTTGLLIVCCKPNKPNEEAAWSAWYDDQHLPDLFARADDATPRVATRFELSTKPQPGMPGLGYSHVTIYEFAGDDPIAKAQRFAACDAVLRDEGRIHPAHAVADAQTFVAHGPYSHKPDPSPALRGHILAWVYPNDPRAEADWDAWYDHEHVPDMMHSGAFAAATRWQRTPRVAYGPNHITLYDVAHPSVDIAVQRSAAVMPGIIAGGRKHPAHTGALTLTLVPTGRYGGTGYRGESR
jgi:hypothetical protein